MAIIPNFVSNGSVDSICLTEGLVPDRQQAITWTNVNEDLWTHMASPIVGKKVTGKKVTEKK